MENGKRKISIEFLEKIADVLDVDVTHFFDKSQEVNLPDGTDAFVLKPDDMEGVTPEEIMEFIRMAQKMKNNK
ncbi:hypothetical protein JCM19046_3551 [Bacillus sp. JCM 19046]|nr:hypothetical protein JCM19045_4225 [Bacillus sp. JCM 19045]GAF18938.1 hypothetical protein JCM19046_3551 [Bacillus sp. JCM 19046]